MATPRKTKTKATKTASAKASGAKAKKKAPPPPPEAARAEPSAKKKAKAKPRAGTRKPAARSLPKAPPAKKAKGPRPAKAGSTAAQPKLPKPKLPKPKPPKPKLPKPQPPKPKPPKLKLRKPKVDAELQKSIREALVNQRQRLLLLVQSTQAQMAEMSSDLADVSDRASKGYGDELAVGLMAIEAAQLDEIEAAIRRIDSSTYGLCLACGKPIPRKRLEVLPFAQRCLACEGQKERSIRSTASYEPDENHA
jgi:RNA polymerase-binding protein DksA